MAQADTLKYPYPTVPADEEQQRADELRRARTGGQKAEVKQDGNKSWAESRLAGRLAGREAEQKGLKEKAVDKATAPVSMGSRRALQWAWTSLIPSFGLSLIWINIHVFLRTVFPNIFCKLGEEWLPKEVLEKTGTTGKAVSGSAFIIEAMALAALNFIAFFIIIAILAIIVWLADSIVFKVISEGIGIWEWATGVFD